jgi:hypothetical protein
MGPVMGCVIGVEVLALVMRTRVAPVPDLLRVMMRRCRHEASASVVMGMGARVAFMMQKGRLRPLAFRRCGDRACGWHGEKSRSDQPHCQLHDPFLGFERESATKLS